jgi:hypothetical protein
MSDFLDLPVVSALLGALVAGFLLGRIGRSGRGDPSDVSRLRRQAQNQAQNQAQGQIHVQPPQASVQAVQSGASSELPPEAVGHLQNGRVINAIKVLKDANPGMGLKQAKDTVEAYQRRNGLI